MKTEYGTGEVILLQTLEYFRKKVEALEGETYRADELDFCYNSLHEDYVQKCAEYNALNKTYEAFNEDFNKMCEERDAAITEANYLRENYKELEKDYNELEKDYNDLRKTTKKLQVENDQHVREWSEQYTEKKIAERLATDMENNYQNLLKDYDELYEENIKLKQALDMRMTECDELKKEIESLKNQISLSPEESEFLTHIAKIAEDEAKIADIVCGDNKAIIPISSEEADALRYMPDWERAGHCASPAQQEVWEENPYWR